MNGEIRYALKLRWHKGITRDDESSQAFLLVNFVSLTTKSLLPYIYGVVLFSNRPWRGIHILSYEFLNRSMGIIPLICPYSNSLSYFALKRNLVL